MTQEEIVKVCKKHGDLTLDMVYKRFKLYKPTGKVHFCPECILCKREYNVKWFDRIRNDVELKIKKKHQFKQWFAEKMKCDEYANNYREKQRKRSKDRGSRAEYSRMYYHKNKEIMRTSYSLKRKLNAHKQINELKDNYVKKILCDSNSLQFQDVPKELVDLKRAQLKLLRSIRNVKQV